MGSPAVQLGDQLFHAPEEIHDEPVDSDVHLRPRKAAAPDQPQKRGFQFAAGVVRLANVADGKPQVLRLANHGGALLDGKNPTQVSQRSRWVRHGDAGSTSQIG